MSKSQTKIKRSFRAITAALFLLGGCGVEISRHDAEVSGFTPIEPRQTSIVTTATAFMGDPQYYLTWPEVASRNPTLQWEPVPGTHYGLKGSFGFGLEKLPFIDADVARLSNVTYEVKIWRVEQLEPIEVVYDRKGLRQPRHRVEVSLEAGQRYYWSVRARFELDGKTRVSEWSLAFVPRSSSGFNARRLERKTGQIPWPNYYRFKVSNHAHAIEARESAQGH